MFEKIAKGKRNQIFSYWNGRKSTYQLVQSVANKTRLCQEDILYKVQVKSRVLTYCGHLEVAEDFKRWCEKPKKRNIEQRIQESLKKEKPGGRIGVPTDIGAIDFLTEEQLVEVKFFKDWKEGVGQLILYGLEYETHQKVLHLYGKLPRETQQSVPPQLRTQKKKDGSNQVLTWELIQEKCKLLQRKHTFLNIEVHWEDKLGTDLEDEDALENEDALEENASVQYNLSDFRINTELRSYK